MKKQMIFVFLLVVCIALSGCQMEQEKKVDEEPAVVSYSWMAGDSPVPARRVGVLRQGLINTPYAVSSAGVYFMEKGGDSKGNFILYADHGSDTLIRLCGRADCSHDTEDCNAYLFRGSALSYYGGHLYGVSGSGSEEECKLVRMNPDGSDHVMILDLLEFAKEHDGDYVQGTVVSDGMLLFDVYHWVESEDNDPNSISYDGTLLQSYLFRLDGSMKEPEAVNYSGMLLHDIPTGFLVWTPESKNGTESGSYLDWNPDTNAAVYLCNHPGQPGWFDDKQVYYHIDGAIQRLDFATGKVEVMADTGLQGNYYLTAFPDCIVLTSRSEEAMDSDTVYIYNWAFEAVDTIELNYSNSGYSEELLIAETPKRLIFTDQYQGNPVYYIEKSELGTGDVQIHEFQYSQ